MSLTLTDSLSLFDSFSFSNLILFQLLTLSLIVSFFSVVLDSFLQFVIVNDRNEVAFCRGLVYLIIWN